MDVLQGATLDDDVISAYRLRTGLLLLPIKAVNAPSGCSSPAAQPTVCASFHLHPCGTRQHKEPTYTSMKLWLLHSPVSDPGISYLLPVSHDILSLTCLLGNRVKPQILQFFLWFSEKDEGLDGLG